MMSIQVREEGKTINANVDSISMGGISAGGQITAVCQQLARNEGYELKLGMCRPRRMYCRETHNLLIIPYSSPRSSLR